MPRPEPDANHDSAPKSSREMRRTVARGYWRAVRRRALDCCYEWPFGSRRAFWGLVLLSFAAVAVVWVWKGWQEAHLEMIVASTPLVVMAVLLLVNLVRAPRLLHEDGIHAISTIERERDALRAERDDARALQATKEDVVTRHRRRMDVLTSALMKFQALGTRPMPVNKSDVPQLEADLTAVVANITGVLYDHFPESDVALFLNVAGMSPIERAGNAHAARLFGLIVVYQENLKNLIGRHSKDGD